MRHKKSRILSRTETKQFAARRNQIPMVFGVLSLLTVLTILLMVLFYPQTTTITHAQQHLSAAQLATLPEAPASNNIKAANEETEEVNEISDSSQTSISAGGDNCSWSNSVNTPVNVLDNGAAVVGSNLYSFGGNSGGITANAYKFDGTAWTAIAPLPVTLTRPGVVSDGTSVYIVNGISGGSTTSATSLYRYNPTTNNYTTLAASPTGVWTPAVTFYNGKIYKIGGIVTAGTSNTSTTAVEVYDIASDTWSTAAAYPTSVGFASAFTLGNFIYAAGGITLPAPPGTTTTKTYRYDPSTNSWDDAAIADLPAARFGAAGATYRGGLIIAGGFVADTPSNSVIQWNPTSNAWVDYPNLPAARARSAGVVYAEGFHVIGGSGAPFSFTGTNTNFRLFCPPTDAPFVTGSVTYVSENGNPPNNTPDPGETVTVSLNLRNVGGVNTGANVTATLQATGGIIPVTTSQNYDTLTAGGAPVSRNFSFRIPADAVCGSQITLTFTVQDGTSTYTVTQIYTLGTRPVLFSENFDGVTAPALPTGWTQVNTGSNTGWVTSTTNPDSAPNSAFDPFVNTPGGADLTSPTINVTSGGGILNFRLRYLTEATYDGAILEIKIGSGAFQEFTAAGGTFAAGAYNSTAQGTGNPLGTTARPAWSGNSNGYINVSAVLPAAANNQTVQFKWRTGHDDLVNPTGGGVNIDNVVLLGAFQCSTVGTTAPTNSRADFDGDGKTDVSVFRGGTWYAQRSSTGFVGVQWGAASDQIVPGDYDGDNKTDFAVYRAGATSGAASFYVLNSATSTVSGVLWGVTGDIAKVGDFDGNNRDDFAVYRPSANAWYVTTNPSGTFVQYTLAGTTGSGSTPITLDYDGDGKTDPAQWNTSTGAWAIRTSGNGATVNVQWGAAGDIPVPADYLGNDNRDELVVYRAGNWLVRLDNGTLVSIAWGAATDVPVPGDYDGDGVDDQAVYRGGTWFVRGSTSNLTTTFGVASDTPIPRTFTGNN